MNIPSFIKNIFQKRNYAVSDIWEIKTGQPIYTAWTIQKAVKDGYKANPVVYRAVTLIVKAASSVPWIVVDDDGEEIENHHITTLIKHPNPFLSRQDMFELLVSWIELAGNAYLKRVMAGGKTAELWPVSPDRIGVMPSKAVDEWILGYSLDNSRRIDFEPDDLIHLKLFNPASPFIGISPLEAVAKVVDTDCDQQDFNKSAMQNRCVLDGIVSFDREFSSQDQADAIAEKLNERYAGPANARRMKVIGSNAKYTRTSATPAEMDFSESRKQNRDLIYQTFGVPPQYAGSQESSTYNNYETSELIFWIQTIIPLLHDISDAFNLSFKGELKQGEKVKFDISQVPAMRQALLEKSKTAKVLFEMGVPFSEVNRIFGFGVAEFDGWDDSKPSTGAAKIEDRCEKKKTIPYLLKRETLQKTRSEKK